MKAIMKLEELTTTEQFEQFLNGTQAVLFEVSSVKKERYDWIKHELIRFNYLQRGKLAKSDAHNLWERLKLHEASVLLFAKDSHVRMALP
jgi:exosome complex RNA-binding protein Rrp4